MIKLIHKWNLTTALTTIFLPIYGGLGYVLWVYLPPVLAKNIEPILYGKILVGLVLILTLFVSYVVHLKKLLSKEVNVKDYEICHPSIGTTFYKLRNDPDPSPAKRWFCVKCLDIDRKASVVHPNYKDGVNLSWYCPTCKTDLQVQKAHVVNDGSLI